MGDQTPIIFNALVAEELYRSQRAIERNQAELNRLKPLPCPTCGKTDYVYNTGLAMCSNGVCRHFCSSECVDAYLEKQK